MTHRFTTCNLWDRSGAQSRPQMSGRASDRPTGFVFLSRFRLSARRGDRAMPGRFGQII